MITPKTPADVATWWSMAPLRRTTVAAALLTVLVAAGCSSSSSSSTPSTTTTTIPSFTACILNGQIALTGAVTETLTSNGWTTISIGGHNGVRFTASSLTAPTSPVLTLANLDATGKDVSVAAMTYAKHAWPQLSGGTVKVTSKNATVTGLRFQSPTGVVVATGTIGCPNDAVNH